MPAGPRIRTDNVFGTVSDSPLTAGALTMNSAGLANLAAVASAHAVVVLDPLRSAGAPEIVIVTAHTASATSATITRGAYGTTARQHAAGVLWVHAPTVEDVIRIVTSSTRPSDPYQGQLIYETDTNKFVGFGGTDWAPRDAGGTLGYAQVTANQGAITTEVDLAGLTATVTVGTGRRIRVTGYVAALSTTVSGDGCRVSIKEGANLLQLAQSFVSGTAAGADSQRPEVVLTPTPGLHTYKLAAARVSGTGTLTMNADPTFPAFILVEDIGAA